MQHNFICGLELNEGKRWKEWGRGLGDNDCFRFSFMVKPARQLHCSPPKLAASEQRKKRQTCPANRSSVNINPHVMSNTETGKKCVHLLLERKNYLFFRRDTFDTLCLVLGQLVFPARLLSSHHVLIRRRFVLKNGGQFPGAIPNPHASFNIYILLDPAERAFNTSK